MTNQLDRLCEQALKILISTESDESNQTNGFNADTKMDHVVMKINHLCCEIMSHTPNYPVPEHIKLTSQQLEDFSLPPPYFHTHPIPKISNEELKEKLREVIDAVNGRTHRTKKLSGRRHAPTRTPSHDSGTVDPEVISSPDDVIMPSKPVRHLPRPGSAPNSKLHSLSDYDIASGTHSLPTSPRRSCASSSSGSVPFSNSHHELSDAIGGETESSGSNDRSTSVSPDSESTSSSSTKAVEIFRSYSPASSDSGSLYSSITLNSIRRGSLAVYGSGNMVGSMNRKMSMPVQCIEGSTGSMVRVKGGAHTLRVRRKSRPSLHSTAAITKIVKIVLVGNDELINNMAYAYADLR